MTGYRVQAMLTLAPTEEGGLTLPLPAGTRSLLLRFPAVGEANPELVTLGAVLTPQNGTELAPGAVTETDVLFWSDDARIHATAGASFDLWYGRPVGHGTVTSVADDFGDEQPKDKPAGSQP
jgi:hypothetical protein